MYFVLCVLAGPALYALYLFLGESQVSGVLAHRREAREAQARIQRRERAWAETSERHAAALVAWRATRAKTNA